MPEPFVFVHAADLHLDAPFRRVDVADGRVRDACVSATYEAFERIVDVCLDRGADFLVVAGDAYNVASPSVRAQSRFRAGAARLAEAGVSVYLTGGNHDPVGGRRDALPMPDNVYVFPATGVERVEFVKEGVVRCAIYGRSYGRARETANLARDFSRLTDDPFAVGVLHANVGGNQLYEPYAPCSLQDLHAARMDYWALGHIHQYQELAAHPPVIYPGSPQGLDPNEIGGHGCVVVTVGASGTVTLDFVETASVAWERASVDLGSSGGLGDVLDEVRRVCAAARESAGGRPVLMRIDLTGRSEAHAALSRPGALEGLIAEVRDEQLSETPWVWVDRIRDLTRPALDMGRIREGADFSSDLVRIADETSAEEIDELLAEVLDPIAASVRGLDLDLDATGVFERARDLALDRLLAGEGER